MGKQRDDLLGIHVRVSALVPESLASVRKGAVGTAVVMFGTALALALAVDTAAHLNAGFAHGMAHSSAMRPGDLRFVLPRLLPAHALVLAFVTVVARPMVRAVADQRFHSRSERFVV